LHERSVNGWMSVLFFCSRFLNHLGLFAADIYTWIG
jgi:hypothetical protein